MNIINYNSKNSTSSKDYINDSDWIFVDRAHLTDKGNAKVAEFISTILY